MITMQTLNDMYHAMREISVAKDMLKEMAEIRQSMIGASERERRSSPTLKDAFGRVQNLQLGIPSGSSSHRLLDVRPELAETIIRAHIAAKQALLIETNERARVELNMELTPEQQELMK